MVSARQTFAFRARCIVPPDLTVTSAKCFRAKQLDTPGAHILGEIQHYYPEMVVLNDRWSARRTKKIVKKTGTTNVFFAIAGIFTQKYGSVKILPELSKNTGDIMVSRACGKLANSSDSVGNGVRAAVLR